MKEKQIICCGREGAVTMKKGKREEYTGEYTREHFLKAIGWENEAG